MKNKLSITLKNNVAEIARLLEILESFGKKNNFSESSIFDISLVMDEIATNVIMHGYEDDEEHFIDIQILLDENVFSAQVLDDGKEFNPLTHTKISDDIDLEKMAIGGLGIQIITQYVDKIEYKRDLDKNLLKITKSIEFSQVKEKP